jgi:glycine/D-amino acid oxidase-like deaminating enzyme
VKPRRLLTATGLQKWGLALGTAAGAILADLALARESVAWASTSDCADTRLYFQHATEEDFRMAAPPAA